VKPDVDFLFNLRQLEVVRPLVNLIYYFFLSRSGIHWRSYYRRPQPYPKEADGPFPATLHFEEFGPGQSVYISLSPLGWAGVTVVNPLRLRWLGFWISDGLSGPYNHRHTASSDLRRSVYHSNKCPPRQWEDMCVCVTVTVFRYTELSKSALGSIQ
jgi:hypothetical protein